MFLAWSSPHDRLAWCNSLCSPALRQVFQICAKCDWRTPTICAGWHMPRMRSRRCYAAPAARSSRLRTWKQFAASLPMARWRMPKSRRASAWREEISATSSRASAGRTFEFVAPKPRIAWLTSDELDTRGVASARWRNARSMQTLSQHADRSGWSWHALRGLLDVQLLAIAWRFSLGEAQRGRRGGAAQDQRHGD